jgi:DnaJ-class molecular chaperone
MERIDCAFCNARGIDPFKILSPLSKCQVCWGRGTVSVSVRDKKMTCVYCKGSGKHPELRLTCPVCWGKGVVTVNEPTMVCPKCGGTGKAPESKLPCLRCGGKGVIEVI